MNSKIIAVSLSLLLIVCLQYANSAVVGIDLGDEFFKSTLVKPGSPFSIVENTASKRKTPTAFAFTSEERVYGSDAIMQSSSNPANTFSFVLKMLGMEYNDENLEILRKQMYKTNTFTKDYRGYVAFEVDLKVGGETEAKIITVEEVIAIILNYAKRLAETQAKGSIKNVYLTVPHSYTMNQRRMLVDAVEMAGLNCIGMIEENSAAAISYGVDRKDENETHSALFINLGSSNFEVSVGNFYAKKENKTDSRGNVKIGDLVENIEILSYASTEEISGKLFDIEIMNILAENFNSLKVRQGKPDIRENPRIINRLFKEIPKIKDTLSANKEKIINIPELADYENLKMTLTRVEFEEKLEKYLVHLNSTIEEALEKANMTISDISAVEIIGGALRVPKVKDILQDIVKDKPLGTHLNGDEAMSFGAAFMGVNSSSSFIARKLFFHNLVDEPIYLTIESSNLDPSDEKYIKKEYSFFSQGDSLSTRKKYSIETEDNLKATYHTKSKGLIHQIDLEGIPEIIASEDYENHTSIPKVVFITYMSPNGYIEVEKVNAKFTESYIKQVTTRVKVNETETIQNDTQDPTEEVSDEQVPPESEESPTNETEDEIPSSNTTVGPKYEYITEEVTKYRNITKPINYTETFMGHQPLSSDAKLRAVENLDSFETRDKIIQDTNKAKNDYETLIYSSRDWISDEDNQVYSLPDIIEEFNANLTAAENWLYEDGFDETLEVYLDRIDDINLTISSMQYRKEEHLSRDKIINSSLSLLYNFTGMSENMYRRMPWISKTRLERIAKLVENTTEWLTTKIEEQKVLELHENPVLTTYDLREKMYRIGYLVEDIARTPKPKDWDKKIKTSNSTDTNSTNFNSTVNDTYTEQNSTESEYEEVLENDSATEEDQPNDDL